MAKTYPPGLVGILSGDQSRWTWFSQSLLGLQLPQGSVFEWVTGTWVGSAVNMLIDAMRPGDEWAMLWADDHRFEVDVLLRMLDHNLPLVAPVCALRQWGYAPSLFHETATGFQGYTWDELYCKRGLLAVDTFGGPGCVIRREVVETLGKPFFENMPGRRTAPNEDLYAFAKCRKAGFQPYADLGCTIGHCIPAVVYPHQMEDGTWGVRLWSHEDLCILFPRQEPVKGEDYHAYT